MDIKYVTEYLLINIFFVYLFKRFMKVFFGEIQVVIWMQIIYYVFFMA